MKIFKEIISALAENDSTTAGVVGVDIGSSSIKVVELQEKKGVLTLATYGELQLGPYHAREIGEAVALEAKEEQEALVDIIRESAVKARDAVFAMPLSSSFVTNVSIQAESNEDLAPMVRVEARKVIPASLSEVTLDWAEVEVTEKEAEKHDKNRRNVLIAAIQNVALDRFKVLMQFAGFKQPPTEIECFSAIRSVYNADEKDILIIDIGATSAKLYIAKEGLLMRMHRVRAGGTLVTKEIAKAHNISFEAAEKMKLETDRSNQKFSELKKLHDDVYGRAFREFGQVINEYEQKTGVSIKAVYLSGGASLFPGMTNLLGSAINKSVTLSHPFGKVAYPAFMDDTIKSIGPSFMVALGAALRSYE